MNPLWLAAHSLRAVDWPAFGTAERLGLTDGRTHLVRGVHTSEQAKKRRRALERYCGRRVLVAWDRDTHQLAIMATEEEL